jgi:hypothetical protein
VLKAQDLIEIPGPFALDQAQAEKKREEHLRNDQR